MNNGSVVGKVNGNLGQVTSARDGRIGQVALKLSF